VNDFLLAVILGIVEGLTEFLPVSSTAHLRLTQGLLGVRLEDEFWKMFAIVIQLGAILSVVVYFRGRLVGLARTYPRGESGERRVWNHPQALVANAFVVTAGPCYLIDKKIGENLESPWVIGWALVIGGVVMWVVDAWFNRPRTLELERMGLAQAIVIGAAQILAAAFPGTSRSMSTIAAGQVMGLSRAAALEFSFFLSIPVMFAASGFKLVQYVAKRNVPPMTGHRWAVLGVGFVVSFLVAIVVVHWFLKWVKTRGFGPFAVWRLAAGGVVLWMAWRGRIG
jgi:undecaprenyl-diphosphatase